MPVLEHILEQFPFRIRRFHSDNGSEFVNHTVAQLLNKLLIEQTKSQPRHSNDSRNINQRRRSNSHQAIRRPALQPVIPQYRKAKSKFRSERNVPAHFSGELGGVPHVRRLNGRNHLRPWLGADAMLIR